MRNLAPRGPERRPVVPAPAMPLLLAFTFTFAFMAAALASAPAEAAETRRVAVLVGNNQGSAAQPSLHYAEDDVAKVAGVLTEIGGFDAADVHLLTGRSLLGVRAVLTEVKTVIAATRARQGRTVLLFYFSGHSDGEGLELGQDRWLFSDVRSTLKELAPDIRIEIVDSCQSGALLAAKGGTPGPAFDIRFTDDLATSGEAVLTSSAAHERALESREIRASFFSHHLVSGLRGAADSSGDGRVTLGEAYRYAFVNTLLATSNTLTGPQHPAYDFRLSGQGELVLTEVVARGGDPDVAARIRSHPRGRREAPSSHGGAHQRLGEPHRLVRREVRGAGPARGTTPTRPSSPSSRGTDGS